MFYSTLNLNNETSLYCYSYAHIRLMKLYLKGLRGGVSKFNRWELITSIQPLPLRGFYPRLGPIRNVVEWNPIVRVIEHTWTSLATPPRLFHRRRDPTTPIRPSNRSSGHMSSSFQPTLPFLALSLIEAWQSLNNVFRFRTEENNFWILYEVAATRPKCQI